MAFPLSALASTADNLQERIATLVDRLPQSGEPEAVYVLRATLDSDDVRTATVALPDGGKAWIAYIGEMVSRSRLDAEVLRPLQQAPAEDRRLTDSTAQHPLFPSAEKVATRAAQANALVAGRAVVFADGVTVAVDVASIPTRAVGEPKTEQTIIGPKEAFVEPLHTNLALVRRRLQDHSLRVDIITVGRRSHTQLALVYLADVVNPDVLELTRRGVAAIDVDFIRTSQEVAEFLFNASWTTIPLSEQTERSDRAAAAITAGRLCVVVDGTPFVLLVPATFFQTLQDTEEALPGPVTKAFVRTLRLVGMLVALTVAGLYAALLTADTQLMPTNLALAVASSRVGVPYPVLTEVVMMLLVIDVFSEATAQAPGGIGNALSIVGTLIIGQMAVQARLASSLMMIVIAATALGSFLTLKYPFSYTLRIWKYPIALMGGMLGLFGWMGAVLLMLTHLASLKSAGVPYLSPLGPLRQRTLFRSTLTNALKPHKQQRPAIWKVRDPDRLGRRRV